MPRVDAEADPRPGPDAYRVDRQLLKPLLPVVRIVAEVMKEGPRKHRVDGGHAQVAFLAGGADAEQRAGFGMGGQVLVLPGGKAVTAGPFGNRSVLLAASGQFV